MQYFLPTKNNTPSNKWHLWHSDKAYNLFYCHWTTWTDALSGQTGKKNLAVGKKKKHQGSSRASTHVAATCSRNPANLAEPIHCTPHKPPVYDPNPTCVSLPGTITFPMYKLCSSCFMWAREFTEKKEQFIEEQKLPAITKGNYVCFCNQK